MPLAGFKVEERPRFGFWCSIGVLGVYRKLLRVCGGGFRDSQNCGWQGSGLRIWVAFPSPACHGRNL